MKTIAKAGQRSFLNGVFRRPRSTYAQTASSSIERIEEILEELSPESRSEVKQMLYGLNAGKVLAERPSSAHSLAESLDAHLVYCTSKGKVEDTRPEAPVNIGLVQNMIPLPAIAPQDEMEDALEERVADLIHLAAEAGAEVLCLQEAWHMPFAFATREKLPWVNYAQDAHSGRATKFVQGLARKYGMVIVSPILERDHTHGDILWNTAVVVGNRGNVIGIHRKNHIPRVGDFNESTYYMEGDTGHPVFETDFGRISVNICYGRHHPLNWMAFGLNGAEIVFNPSATVGALSEPMWPIEARNAAIANSYFVGAINRVGTERFPNAFTSGDGKPAHHDFGHFFGSSYLALPDASRTPGLSRTRDGVLVTEVDLNLIRQVRDSWTFQMTARYKDYAELLAKYTSPTFESQVVRDPTMTEK